MARRRAAYRELMGLGPATPTPYAVVEAFSAQKSGAAGEKNSPQLSIASPTIIESKGKADSPITTPAAGPALPKSLPTAPISSASRDELKRLVSVGKESGSFPKAPSPTNSSGFSSVSKTLALSALPSPTPSSFEQVLQASAREAPSGPSVVEAVVSPFPEPTQPPPDNREALIETLAAALNGTWILDEELSETVEPLMKELGAPWLIIKAIMASASPPLTFEVNSSGLSILFTGFFVQKNSYTWDTVNYHKTPDGANHPAEICIMPGGEGIQTTVKFPRGTLISSHMPLPTGTDGTRYQKLFLVLRRKNKKTGVESDILNIKRVYKEKSG